MRAEASVLLASISFFFFFSSIHILFHSSAQSEIFYICFRIIQLCNISRRTAGARAKSYPSKRFQTAPHPQLSLEFRELQTPSDLICSCDKVRLGSARKLKTVSYLIGSDSVTGRDPNMEEKREGRVNNNNNNSCLTYQFINFTFTLFLSNLRNKTVNMKLKSGQKTVGSLL